MWHVVIKQYNKILLRVADTHTTSSALPQRAMCRITLSTKETHLSNQQKILPSHIL